MRVIMFLMMNLIKTDKTQWELTNLTLKYYWTQGELINLKPLKSIIIKLNHQVT